MQWSFPLLLILMLTGCSAMASRQHANELNQMRQDDESCINKGVHYPGAGYVSCRYDLQNERLLYEWKCEQILKCMTISPIVSPGSFVQTETYKPLDFEHFRCWPECQFGLDYIFCGVKDGP